MIISILYFCNEIIRIKNIFLKKRVKGKSIEKLFKMI